MQTLIIGGGLFRLALADALQAQSHDYMLVEARDRFGGRIKTEHDGAGYFDMKPAWFWQGQPRIAALIDRLGLETFDQFSSGNLGFEDETGQVQRGRGGASMEGSLRFKGGLGALTQILANGLPEARKRLNAQVIAVTKTDNGITSTLANGDTLVAQHVIFAVPPRIAVEIDFPTTLPPNAVASMENVPTWMVGQAKAVAVYDRAFWRDGGLSGDAISRFGPMVEIQDASPATGGPMRCLDLSVCRLRTAQMNRFYASSCKKKLARLFGAEAAEPK